MFPTTRAGIPSPIPTPFHATFHAAEICPPWWLLWGLLALGILAATVVWAVERLTAAGRSLDAMADPTRCSYCGQPYEAGDDVVSPHEGGREVGF